MLLSKTVFNIHSQKDKIKFFNYELSVFQKLIDYRLKKLHIFEKV